MITEVGIALAEVTLQLQGSFTLEMHYIWLYTCQLSRIIRDIDVAHQGQFLTPDSQIHTNCHLIHINNENLIRFPQIYSKKALNDDFVS